MGLFDDLKEKLDEAIYRGDFQWIADAGEKVLEEIDVIDRKVRRKIDKTFDPLIEGSFITKNEEKYYAEFGDIIGVYRGTYEHYGIYIGGDRVIHYTSYSGKLEDSTIMETGMDNFLRDRNEYFVFDCENEGRQKISTPRTFFTKGSYDASNTFLDEVLAIYTPEETVERAYSRLGENKYDLVFNNCEHFAIWCKTGISKSYQVDRILNGWNKKTIRI